MTFPPKRRSPQECQEAFSSTISRRDRSTRSSFRNLSPRSATWRQPASRNSGRQTTPFATPRPMVATGSPSPEEMARSRAWRLLWLARHFLLGIIPAGTFNNFARSLDLPLDPIEACEVILAGNARPTDVGFANGRPFFECLGSGLDAALYPLSEEIKSGRLHRMIDFLRRAYRYPPPAIRVRARSAGLRRPRARDQPTKAIAWFVFWDEIENPVSPSPP